MLGRAFQYVQVGIGRGLLWFLLGPTYLVTLLDGRYRQTRNLPDRAHSVGGWIDVWRRGAVTGLIAGSIPGLIYAWLKPPQNPAPVLYLIAFLGCCGLSLGGAIGFLCGGGDAETSLAPSHSGEDCDAGESR